MSYHTTVTPNPPQAFFLQGADLLKTDPVFINSPLDNTTNVSDVPSVILTSLPTLVKRLPSMTSLVAEIDVCLLDGRSKISLVL